MTVTGDDAHDHADPSGSGGDYSYDLVHDEVPATRRTERTPDRRQAEPEPEVDQAGDYSYDLAHEVPPSRPR